MIRTLKQTLTAGQTWEINFPADTFRLLETSGPVTVRFYRNGAEQGAADDMEAGFSADGQQFDKVTIYSASAQSVKFSLSDGGMKYDRMAGSVSVTNFPATQQVSGSVSAAITTPENPQVYGASYASNATLVANTAVQVIAPASNVAGVIIHQASMSMYFSAGSGFGCLIAKSSAPANNADGDVLLTNGSGATAQVFNTASIKGPIKVPAGKGIYFINSGSEGSGLRSCQYTIL